MQPIPVLPVTCQPAQCRTPRSAKLMLLCGNYQPCKHFPVLFHCITHFTPQYRVKKWLLHQKPTWEPAHSIPYGKELYSLWHFSCNTIQIAITVDSPQCFLVRVTQTSLLTRSQKGISLFLVNNRGCPRNPNTPIQPHFSSEWHSKKTAPLPCRTRCVCPDSVAAGTDGARNGGTKLQIKRKKEQYLSFWILLLHSDQDKTHCSNLEHVLKIRTEDLDLP